MEQMESSDNNDLDNAQINSESNDSSNSVDQNKIEDSLFMAGLTGSDQAKLAFNSLRTKKNILLRNEKEAFGSEKKILSEEIQLFKNKKLEVELNVEDNKKLLSENQTEARQNSIELSSLDVKEKQLIEEINIQRAQYPEKLVKDKITKYKLYNSEILDLVYEQLKKRQDHEKEIRELNKEEYSRRINYFKELKLKVEENLSELGKYINVIKRFGLTKTVAGFLVWCGYFALPGIGWALGGAISNLQSKDNDFLRGFIALVVTSLGNITNGMGVIPSLLLIFFFPLIFIGAVFLIIYLFDKALEKFDDEWGFNKKYKKRIKSKSDFNLSEYFMNPGKEFERRDYTRIISKLPIIYFWITITLVIAFLVKFSNQTNNIADLVHNIVNPGTTVLFAYFGVITSLLITSILMLYSVKVIEPRIIRMIKKDQITAMDTFKANFEIVILVVCFVLLIFPGELYYVNVFHTSLWDMHSTLLLMILVLIFGFGLSYGLIYRGIFRDFDLYTATINVYETNIQKYEVRPVYNSIYDDVDEFINNLKELQTDIKNIWNNVDFWNNPIKSIKQIPFSKHFYRNSEEFDERIRHSDDFISSFRLKSADEYFEPMLAEKIREIQLQKMQLKHNLDILKTDQVRIADELIRLNDENDLLREKINELRYRINRREKKYYEAVAEISGKYVIDSASASSVYEMGKKLKSHFDEVKL